MENAERQKKLHEIEDMLVSFLGSEKRYEGLSASYFTPHCFARDNQGIHCVYEGTDESVVEDLLGYLDIPAMLNGFSVETVRSQANGNLHIFVYDEDQFHIDNLKKLNIMTSKTIFSKRR